MVGRSRRPDSETPSGNLRTPGLVAQRLGVDPERLRAFCRGWKVAELALFGSALRDDFGPRSDVDVLVRWEPGAT